MAATRYTDRAHAGRVLAEALRRLDLHRPLVLGVPRGGVEVACAVAAAIGAELDVVLARKLRAPGHPELAIGAVGEDESIVLEPTAGAVPGVTPTYVESEAACQRERIGRDSARLRALRPRADPRGRSVIVVDDGLATGATLRAAVLSLRGAGAREIIAAVPVGASESLRRLASVCDRVVCPLAPPEFHAVGQFYERFEPVTDRRVEDLLRSASDARSGPGD